MGNKQGSVHLPPEYRTNLHAETHVTQLRSFTSQMSAACRFCSCGSTLTCHGKDSKFLTASMDPAFEKSNGLQTIQVQIYPENDSSNSVLLGFAKKQPYYQKPSVFLEPNTVFMFCMNGEVWKDGSSKIKD